MSSNIQFYKKFEIDEDEFDSHPNDTWITGLELNGEGIWYGFDLAFEDSRNFEIRIKSFEEYSDIISVTEIVNDFKNVKTDRSIITYESTGGMYIIRAIFSAGIPYENLEIDIRRTSGSSAYLKNGHIFMWCNK